MSVTIVLPSIHVPYTRACLASLDPRIVDVGLLPTPHEPQRETKVCIVNGCDWTDGHPDVRLAVIWNTPKHNLGVAASWNIGISDVLANRRDWLVILSAGVRFGPRGGRDFLGWLRDFQEERPDILGVEGGDGLGWHLLAFPRHVLERVGEFDAEAFPSYFEDNDYSVRIQRAFGRDTKDPEFQGPLWPKVTVDAHLESVAHGIKLGNVTVNFEELRRRFERKWGPDESFATPYNDPSLDYTYTGPAPIDVLAW